MSRSVLSNFRAIAAFVIVVPIIFTISGACQSDGNGGGGGGGTSGDEGILLGQVWSLEGAPIPGVAVTLNNGRSASTEDNGFYSFSDLTAGDSIVATFRRSGYASTAKSLTVQAANAAAPVCIIMASAAETVTISADVDTTQRSGDSAVTISAGSIVDDNGDPVTGDVQLTATFLDPSTDEVQAFPGSFDDAESEAGQDVSIESFGFAIYELTQDGEEVNLAAGATAEIEYVLPDNAQSRFSVGDTIPLWEFDEQTATWLERGQGEVHEASDGSGRLAWSAAVDHFSAWNADLPIEEKSCITGRVVSRNEPVVGASITATGADYNGTSSAHTDADGIFCVEVKRGSTVTIEVRLNGAAPPVATRQVVAFDIPADCSNGVCADTGDIEIELDSCVAGRVTDADGIPIPIEYVYVAPGAVTVTDGEGYYCARAPANTNVYVLAKDRPAIMAVTPGSGSCSNEAGCAQVNLTLEIPGVGDTVGQLEVTKQVIHTGISGVPKLGEPLHSLSISGSFLIFDPEQMGNISFSNFSTEVEEIGACTVRTITVSTSLDEMYSADFGLGGIGALDAGSPGVASNGLVSVELFPGDPFAYPEAPMPAAAGFYNPKETGEELLGLGFGAGQTITFAFPGGADIGPFEATIDVPPDLEVTVPDLADPDTTLDLAAPLDLVWVADDSSNTIEVTLMASDTVVSDFGDETFSSTMTTTIVTCEFTDDGAGTVPDEVTARLPADASMMSLGIARSRNRDANAPLNRVDGNGVVQVSGRAGVYRAFYEFEIPNIDDLLPDDYDPDEFDLCVLLGIICEEGEVCNTDSYPFTCVPE